MMNGRTYRRHLLMRMIECQVPDHLHEGLVEYLAARRPVGSFLTAVLSNNLMDACVRADDLSRPHLVEIALFLLNYAPANAWGNEKAVFDWLEARSEPVPEVYE
jgi:hypothetical protein